MGRPSAGTGAPSRPVPTMASDTAPHRRRGRPESRAVARPGPPPARVMTTTSGMRPSPPQPPVAGQGCLPYRAERLIRTMLRGPRSPPSTPGGNGYGRDMTGSTRPPRHDQEALTVALADDHPVVRAGLRTLL